MRLFVVLLTLLVTGCTAPPPAPVHDDYAVILDKRLDSLWQQSGLDDSLRPDVAVGEPVAQFDAARLFAACMVERGWTNYFVNDNGKGYGYRAIQLASSDAETLDWYRCFAANPVDSQYTMGSVAQFDLVYDYYQDTLIPCLAENGYPIERAPSRADFVSFWLGVTDPLFPFVWNPYHEIGSDGSILELPIAKTCPPTPPNQEFYTYR